MRLVARTLVRLMVLSAGCVSSDPAVPAADVVADIAPPNIVLIAAAHLDDGPGSAVETLAGRGTTFPRVHAVGDTPAAVRSSVLTGVHPSALGLETAKSHSDRAAGLTVTPRSDLRVFPELLRRAGYYTVRSGDARHNLFPASRPSSGAGGLDSGSERRLLGAWDVAGPGLDWQREAGDPCAVSFGCGSYSGEPSGPFFVMFTLGGGGGIDDADIDDAIRGIVTRLDTDGLLDETVVLVVGLDGRSPLVTLGAGTTGPGTTRRDAVSTLDLAPTVLALADVPVPTHMPGRAVLGASAPVRDGEQPAKHPRRGASDARADLVEPWGDEEPPVAATPRGYPTGGVFHGAPWVELWCDTKDSTIVYATELVAPFHWRLYTEPFRMYFWKLRFQCGRLGYADSPIVTYDFDIE